MIIEFYFKPKSKSKFKFQRFYRMGECGDKFARDIATKIRDYQGIGELRISLYEELPKEKVLLKKYYELLAEKFNYEYSEFGDIHMFRLTEDLFMSAKGVKLLLMFVRLPNVEIGDARSPIFEFWKAYDETEDFLFSTIVATSSLNIPIWNSGPLSQIGSLSMLRGNHLETDFKKIKSRAADGYYVSNAIRSSTSKTPLRIDGSIARKYLEQSEYKKLYELFMTK